MKLENLFKYLTGAFIVLMLTDAITTTKEEIATREKARQETKMHRNLQKYGSVLYIKNPEAENQIYIVLLENPTDYKLLYGSRRRARVKLETYRIAESIIKARKLELILVPGDYENHNYDFLTYEFFKGKLSDEDLSELKEIDDDALEKRMLDLPIKKTPEHSQKIMDVPRLLKLNFPDLKMLGVDNDQLYVLSLIISDLLETEKKPSKRKQFLSDLDYLNSLRSAQALINAPLKTEAEFDEGRIQKREAIILIEISNEIIPSIRVNKVKILQRQIKLEDRIIESFGLEENLSFGKRGYGVKVIAPNCLLN